MPMPSVQVSEIAKRTWHVGHASEPDPGDAIEEPQGEAEPKYASSHTCANGHSEHVGLFGCCDNKVCICTVMRHPLL